MQEVQNDLNERSSGNRSTLLATYMQALGEFYIERTFASFPSSYTIHGRETCAGHWLMRTYRFSEHEGVARLLRSLTFHDTLHSNEYRNLMRAWTETLYPDLLSLVSKTPGGIRSSGSLPRC